MKLVVTESVLGSRFAVPKYRSMKKKTPVTAAERIIMKIHSPPEIWLTLTSLRRPSKGFLSHEISEKTAMGPVIPRYVAISP